MLMRTDPFREFDRWAQSLLGTPVRPAAMPVDAYRTDDALFVHLDLPGVKAGSIDVTVDKDTLTVRAERAQSAPEGTEFIIAERPAGVFSRQLFLGDGLDTEHIEAHYADGVLTLRLPIAEHAKPRKIEVGSQDKVPALAG
ncbi:MAG TPA: Hsp20/alpha crystallin family protein [Trebonia sp.]|jgi:HSP20 family protein|nr:Hsp20/alpha crystallin family protein [Trebonia sp.]